MAESAFWLGVAGLVVGLATLVLVWREHQWAVDERKRRETVDAQLRQMIEKIQSSRDMDRAGLPVDRSGWDAVALGVRMGLLETWWNDNTIRVGAKRN